MPNGSKNLWFSFTYCARFYFFVFVSGFILSRQQADLLLAILQSLSITLNEDEFHWSTAMPASDSPVPGKQSKGARPVPGAANILSYSSEEDSEEEVRLESRLSSCHVNVFRSSCFWQAVKKFFMLSMLT